MVPTSDAEAGTQGEQSTLRIGQPAKLAAVHVETLRYYEREGLREKPYQHMSGYRAYPLSAVAHRSARGCNLQQAAMRRASISALTG